MPADRPHNSNPPAAANCPGLIDLAAYLEGRASEHEADAIDLHLAQCSACLESVREYREFSAEGEHALVLVPPRVVEQAMALVPARAVPQWWVTTRRAAAIAATVAVCTVGYQVGAVIATPTADSIDGTTNMYFGLLEEDELESGDDLLFATEGEVS